MKHLKLRIVFPIALHCFQTIFDLILSLMFPSRKFILFCFESTMFPRYVSKLQTNGGASFRWSFCPHSAWGSKESTNILTMHPSLQKNQVKNEHLCMILQNKDFLYLHLTFIIRGRIVNKARG